MWLKIVCVVVLAGGALAGSDELLEALSGRGGGNRVDVCVATRGGWRRCAGALCSRDWLLARARCLAAAPPANLTAQLRAVGGSCERLANGTWDMAGTRRVLHVVMHPWFDLALATLVRPYGQLDRHANTTQLRLKLKPHGVYKWMKDYIDIRAKTLQQYYQASLVQKPRHLTLWYFLVTMLLPAVLFMLFFIYVTTCTGNSVQYKEMQYSKKVTHV